MSSTRRALAVAAAHITVVAAIVLHKTGAPLEDIDGQPRGVLHSFDYPFYFFDVRRNAADRIAAFNEK